MQNCFTGRYSAQQPEHVDAIHNLGVIAQQVGRNDLAVNLMCRSWLRPDSADAHINLGNALKETGKLDEAIAAYRRSIALRLTRPQPTTILVMR